MRARTLGQLDAAVLLFAGALATAGCGGTTPEPVPANDNNGESAGGPITSGSGTSGSGTSGPGAGTSGAAGGFEVHEWGVVDVPAAGTAEVGAGPGQPSPSHHDMPVRKPVLYFHADPGAALPSVDVVARIPGGALIEHWPAAGDWPATSVTADGVSWRGLSLGACGRPSVARGPAREAESCRAPDGYCEVNDLPGYETADASCVSSGGFEARLLFYRGTVSSPVLPLAVSRDASGAISLRASEANGSEVLFVTGGRGIVLPWPAIGATVTLPDAFTESFDGEALSRTMAAMVTRAGLSSDETDAFMRAWSEPFFQSRWSGATRDVPERAARRLTQAPAPILLYVMPEAAVSRVAELTISPPPRALRRVMVVRVELPR